MDPWSIVNRFETAMRSDPISRENRKMISRFVAEFRMAFVAIERETEMINFLKCLPSDRAGLLNVRSMLWRAEENAKGIVAKTIAAKIEIVNQRLSALAA